MITFITNPAAGSGHSLKVEQQIRAVMQQKEIECSFIRTEYPGHATILAAQAAGNKDCTAVISVGGDGTAFEVACGLISTQVPMGIIPAGTGNDFIKSVKTPSDPLAALELIMKGEPRPVDVGRLNDRLFLNVCGTGFDVTVLENMLEAKKHMRGILPYLVGLLKALAHYQPVHIRLTVDEELERELDAVICSIANGQYIGGGIHICPQAKPDDGLLNLVLVHQVRLARMICYLPGLLMGKILQFGVTEHKLCRKIRLCGQKMRINVDGEIFEMDDAEFEILPSSLQLFW